jgi:hypothetical protein
MIRSPAFAPVGSVRSGRVSPLRRRLRAVVAEQRLQLRHQKRKRSPHRLPTVLFAVVVA